MKLDVKTLDDALSGQIDVVDAVFAVTVRRDILHRVVLWQLEKRRAPARAAKERSDVARTGKKSVRQKGSGGARHGDKKAPIFRGGGKAHGPRARTFGHSLNKKIRAMGLRCALSAKVQEGKILVLEDFILAEAKTKMLAAKLAKLGLEKALFVDGAVVDANFLKACANLPNINVLPSVGANVYDILRHDSLVLTRSAVADLTARCVPQKDVAHG